MRNVVRRLGCAVGLRRPIEFFSALMLISIAAGAVSAAEPRPWLCRDKPVFSSSGPARMDLTSHDSRHWQVFLMQFDPSGGHDGFTITNNYDLGPGVRHEGEALIQGRYFAVALYGSGGHWICSGQAGEQHAPGTITHLCYSPDGGSCDVSLDVKPAGN